MDTQITDTDIHSSSEHHQLTLDLINSASREINIHCHDLTNRIYNHPDIAAALAKFITKNSSTRTVRILVNNIESIISSDHKILEVCRRLSSNIKIHKLAQQHASNTLSFILVDSNTFIKRTDYTVFDGKLDCNPKQAKELLNLFNEFWSHSELDNRLNRLHL